MNIKFKSINIQNFRSIQSAFINLVDQGIVVVKGINEYEDKATSNGSGKSSIFEAIVFALFEETSSGEKDVANRIIGDGYSITLKFDIDINQYIIIRELKGNKTTVSLYKNDIDISARTKTDTNKLILSILGISKSVFLDSIFLSQSVSTNLSNLSPTARKERLEVLTNTDSNINSFKDKLKNIQLMHEANCVTYQANINTYQGKKQSLESQKQDLENKIYLAEQELERIRSLGNIQEIDKLISDNEQRIVDCDKSIQQYNAESSTKEVEIQNLKDTNKSAIENKSNIDKELLDITNKYAEIQSSCTTTENYAAMNLKNIERLKQEIDNIQNSDTCPTCGRKYDNFDRSSLERSIAEKQKNIDEINSAIALNNQEISEFKAEMVNLEQQKTNILERQAEVQTSYNTANELITSAEKEYQDIINKVMSLQNEKSNIQNNIYALQNKKTEILKASVSNIEEFKTMLASVEENIKSTEADISSETDKLSNENNIVGVIKHSIQLVTKEFRTYLLQNSIDYLNTMLKEYSSKLFSNEKDNIIITSDDAKLDIYLGNAPFESLSGGEKTRVNIALLLAQKSLANIIGNVSCNIIILDEVLGYCDAKAELNVVDLITEKLDSLESIYMISHKEIPIGYDSELVIVKDKDGLSRVRN